MTLHFKLAEARRRYCMTQTGHPIVAYAARDKLPFYCLRCRVDVPRRP